ncbi:MAG: NAD-dependent epimerase/dehydratase family protein [Chitinophagales bacterium]|nr:NAD-dependent epimerase/dehydratase family protein [Chitinophagales bacterium]
MAKLIITGINGFIGSHLANYLLSHTEDEIIGVDCHDTHNPLYIKDTNRLKYFNLESFYNHLELFEQIDCVFHVGAISSTTEKNWDKINLYNIYLSRQLIDFAYKNEVPFIFTSSASLYGHLLQSNLSCTHQFFSQYTYSKSVIEQYIQKLNTSSDFRVCVLRLFNVYGKNEQHKGQQASPYFKFIQQVKTTGVIKLFEDSGDYLRDFISVEDVVEIMYHAYLKEAHGTFNIGTGVTRSFESIANKIAEVYQGEIKTIKMPEELKPHYQIYTKAENTTLLKAIGEYRFRNILNDIEDSKVTQRTQRV